MKADAERIKIWSFWSLKNRKSRKNEIYGFGRMEECELRKGMEFESMQNESLELRVERVQI
jgi:hypothetical protein